MSAITHWRRLVATTRADAFDTAVVWLCVLKVGVARSPSDSEIELAALVLSKSVDVAHLDEGMLVALASQFTWWPSAKDLLAAVHKEIGTRRETAMRHEDGGALAGLSTEAVWLIQAWRRVPCGSVRAEILERQLRDFHMPAHERLIALGELPRPE